MLHHSLSGPVAPYVNDVRSRFASMVYILQPIFMQSLPASLRRRDPLKRLKHVARCLEMKLGDSRRVRARGVISSSRIMRQKVDHVPVGIWYYDFARERIRHHHRSPRAEKHHSCTCYRHTGQREKKKKKILTCTPTGTSTYNLEAHASHHSAPKTCLPLPPNAFHTRTSHVNLHPRYSTIVLYPPYSHRTTIVL